MESTTAHSSTGEPAEPFTGGGEAAALFDRAVDNQVSRLRRKIEADSRNPTLIQTVWGGGYMLAAHVRRISA